MKPTKTANNQNTWNSDKEQSNKKEQNNKNNRRKKGRKKERVKERVKERKANEQTLNWFFEVISTFYV